MKNNNTTDGVCLMFTYHSLTANNEKCLQVVDYYKKVINPNVYVPQIYELQMAKDLSEHQLANLSAVGHREYQNYISDKSFNGNFIFFDEKEYDAFTPEYWVFEKDIQSQGGKVLAFNFNHNTEGGGFTLIQPKTPVSNMPVYGAEPFETSSLDDSQRIVDIVVKVMKELICEYPNLMSDMNKLTVAPNQDNKSIDELIEEGVVELKMYKSTPDHADIYGFNAKNPLFIDSLYVNKNIRLKGIGTQVLKYIDDYAIKNGHDAIFGHVASKAVFTKDDRPTCFCDVDMIKNWLYSKGYAVNQDNNDFHKIAKHVGKVVKTETAHATKEETVWVSAHILAAMFNCSPQSIYHRANYGGLPHSKYGNKETGFKFDLKKAEKYFKKHPLNKHEKYRP